MKRLFGFATAIIVAAMTVVGCANVPEAGWVTLIDGEKGLDNWNRVGDANWRAENGAIVADKGKGGFLVSKKSYRNFMIYAEFYAETDTNSGIFLRCSDPQKVGGATAYEVNIWDIRPDPTYATGAIVNVASVPVPLKYKAGGKWNTFEIYANGPQMIVKLNGDVTANAHDTTHASGPFALQYGFGVKGATGGPIKWRKVQVKEL